MKNGDYNLVKAPTTYPGMKYRNKYCYEHHLVWWKETGEVLQDGEVLHHANGDYRDNRIGNLVKLMAGEHSQVHAKTKTIITLTCSGCGREFERELRQLHKKNKKFFCNRECYRVHTS